MSTPMSEYNELLNFKPKPNRVVPHERTALEGEKLQKKENSFATSFGIQTIIVLIILIIMLCLNTFFLEEYESIEKYLRAELAVQVDWKNLLDTAKTFLRL